LKNISSFLLLIRDGVPRSYLVTGKHLVAGNGNYAQRSHEFREASRFRVNTLSRRSTGNKMSAVMSGKCSYSGDYKAEVHRRFSA